MYKYLLGIFLISTVLYGCSFLVAILPATGDYYWYSTSKKVEDREKSISHQYFHYSVSVYPDTNTFKLAFSLGFDSRAFTPRDTTHGAKLDSNIFIEIHDQMDTNTNFYRKCDSVFENTFKLKIMCEQMLYNFIKYGEVTCNGYGDRNYYVRYKAVSNLGKSKPVPPPKIKVQFELRTKSRISGADTVFQFEDDLIYNKARLTRGHM